MKTDDELIKWLREGVYPDVHAAADRIEQLLESIKGLSEAWATAAVNREVSEGKLAKAVEILRETDQTIMFHNDETSWRLWGEDAVSDIRKVLAELEKEE